MKVAIIITDNREPTHTYDSPTPFFAAGAASLFSGLALLRDLEVHIISCAQQPMQSSPEKLADNVWFHSLHVPKTGWLRTFYQGCVRAVRKKVTELKPDLVHGWGTERECAISAVFSGFPNVLTIQGNMAEIARLHHARFGSYLWLTARLENFTLRRAHGVLCNSTYTANLVRPRSRKTWLAPHALRMEFFKPIPTAEMRPPVLLNAGVISSRKRQLELLDVAEKLHRRGLKFEFRFIGVCRADAYATAFLKRIQPMESAGYARFLGELPDSELVRCYDSVAGVVHFPTEEAFGNVVIESLSRNLKFFGSHLGGIVDIANGAPGAELFEKEDWNGLTNSIARWIELGCQRPCDAAELIRERYHPKIIAQRHLEIYRDALDTRS
jgi:glycosyltransferase involved in cell wall biosynthesis